MQKTLANWTSHEKDEKTIDVWIDGLCEPNPGGIGCIGFVIEDNGVTIVENSCVVGKGPEMTNNVAEYQALIYALKEIRGLHLEKAIFMIRLDSELLVKQMNRRWEVKAPLLLQLFTLAKTLASGLHYRIEWIPREENTEADGLASLAFEGLTK
jgi:probable phosphoglycerate mutase